MCQKKYTIDKIHLFVILLIFTILSCSKKEEPISNDHILVRIGDKIITDQEFKRRAEYTIRPAYCNSDNYIHRKIVLNSLIAEKLLALEAGTENELTQNDQFQNYLRGRKGQAMRQWLFYHDFHEKVEVDTAELKKRYKLTGRTYKIDYVSLNHSIAKAVETKLQQGISFDSVFASLEEIPQREVTWDGEEHDAVYRTLFTQPVKKGEVLGPLKIEKENYLVMRVNGWSDFRYITDTDVRTHVRDVKERLVMDEAVESYEKFVGEVMRGKSMELNPKTFEKLTHILGHLYLKSEQEKKEAFNNQFWNKESEQVVLDESGAGFEPILDDPLLTLDGEVWTVRRFRKEMQIHPLVFREKRIERSDFAEHLKYAIADLIRDKFIAEEARQRGYDQEQIVQSNVVMWEDYLLGLYRRNSLLESIDKLDAFYDNYLEVIEEDLNPYVQKIYQKHSDEIFINTDLFESIELSRIDMFVLRNSVPFPMVVPNFPLLTTYNKLDYGNKLSD